MYQIARYGIAMEQHERLKHARVKRGFETAADAARAFNWKQPTYTSHENGTRPISRKAALAYASAFRVSAGWLLYGENEDAAAPEPILVHVRGNTACGLWAEDGRYFDEEYPPIPAVPTVFKDMEQFAFRVSGNCMDRLRIFDGDFVVCVAYWMARTSISDGDIVVIERRRGGLVERTCKQAVVKRGSVEFWPRSTHSEYSKPVTMAALNGTDKEGAEVEVVGLVIGRYAPIG